MARTKRVAPRDKESNQQTKPENAQGKTRASSKRAETPLQAPGPVSSERVNGAKRMKPTTDHRAQHARDNNESGLGTGDEALMPPPTSTAPLRRTQTGKGVTTGAQANLASNGRLSEARNYLSTHDYQNDPDFVQHYETTLAFFKTVDADAVDKKLFYRVRAMLRVHSARMQRVIRKESSDEWRPVSLSQGSIRPHEIQMAFALLSKAPTHPLSWTKKYWKFQSLSQHKAAMPPPPRHPRREPLEQLDPSGIPINQAQCRERWRSLRILQFDLLYMTYASKLQHDAVRLESWRHTPEGRMLAKLRQQNLISTDFKRDWESIRLITGDEKIKQMEPVAVESFLFEGVKNSTTTIFRYLSPTQYDQLRNYAARYHDLGRQALSEYNLLLVKLLDELEKYDVLMMAFAEEQESYQDRKVTAKKSDSLRKLAQPLNTPNTEVPSVEKAKKLLSDAILRENIDNKRSQVIDHSHNWGYVRQIDENTRRTKFFSLSRWSGPPAILTRDSTSGPRQRPSAPASSQRGSLSTSSSGPAQPPGGFAMSPVQELPTSARDIYEARVGNAQLAGLGPDPNDIVNSSSRRISDSLDRFAGSASNDVSSGLSLGVGSGLLVPPEVLGLSPTEIPDGDAALANRLSNGRLLQNQVRTQIPTELLRVDSVRARGKEILKENDAQIAEVRRLRGLEYQHPETYVQGRAAPETSPSLPLTQITPQMLNDLGGYDRNIFPYGPPIFPPDWDLARIERHIQDKRSQFINSSGNRIRLNPPMTTSILPPTSTQPAKPPLQGPAMPPPNKVASTIRTQPPTATRKRSAETDLNPPVKRLFPKWDPSKSQSIIQQQSVSAAKSPTPLLVSQSEFEKLNHPSFEQKSQTQKRPAPIEPPSPRKRHSPTWPPGLDTIGSGKNQPLSYNVELNAPPAKPINTLLARNSLDTPTTPKFRSPRRAPAPPEEVQPQKVGEDLAEVPLSADELFAMGFPAEFGPQKTVTGNAEPAAGQTQDDSATTSSPPTVPTLTERNSPQPAFGQSGNKPVIPPATSSFGKPSFVVYPPTDQMTQSPSPHLTPPPHPPPPRSPPPFPTAHRQAPSPPSMTGSSLPVASLSTIRGLGLPPDTADDSSDEDIGPLHSQTVSAFKQALKEATYSEDDKGNGDELEGKAAAVRRDSEDDSDSDADSDEDDLFPFKKTRKDDDDSEDEPKRKVAAAGEGSKENSNSKAGGEEDDSTDIDYPDDDEGPLPPVPSLPGINNRTLATPAPSLPGVRAAQPTRTLQTPVPSLPGFGALKPMPAPATSAFSLPGLGAVQSTRTLATPAWTQNQASITGTGEAWTRPGGSGVSTRGRVSRSPEDHGLELAIERELETPTDVEDSLYPDTARGEPVAPDQATGNGGASLEKGEERTGEGGGGEEATDGGGDGESGNNIDYLFDDPDDDVIDWSEME